MSQRVCKTCHNWATNIEKVEAPRRLLQARNPGSWNYDGALFKFCPWCGCILNTEPLPETVSSSATTSQEKVDGS